MPGSLCSSTGTPTTTPGTGSRARTRKRLPCAAHHADRYPSRHSFPPSPGGPGLTLTRSTSPATMTSAGCRAWCGRVKATGSGGSPPRSPQPAATLPWCIAVIWLPTCPRWPPRPPLRRPWSCITPPCLLTSRPRSGGVRRHGTRPRGRLAVQRRTRRRAGHARAHLPGRAVRARPGRPDSHGLHRPARNMAAMASLRACGDYCAGPVTPLLGLVPVTRRSRSNSFDTTR